MADTLLNVLVVDDSLTQYTMVGDFLQVVTTQIIEYSVHWASTYEEGVVEIQSGKYDVCLIDYELGNRNGLDFITFVVQNQISIPMILLTGHGSYEVDLLAMEAGAVDYLDKASLKPKILERSIRYATQNQRMLERERQQRAITEALLDTAIALNSSLDFDEVLERILTNMTRVIPHDAVNIFLLEGDTAQLVRSHGYSDEQLSSIDELLTIKVEEIASLKQMLCTQKPLLINDVTQSKDWIPTTSQPIQSYLGVPIVIQDQVIGFLNFDGYNTHTFTDEHAHYGQIFAQQAAQAIRNTRAYDQAKVLAATQERQRLARDLHDAVSQTLFSASVIAQTLPRLIDHNPQEVLNGLAELNRLNRGALAEMRTLLVELRPQSLVETDLPTLLRNLILAFTSRAQLEVEPRINYAYVLPEDVHIVFYRIAQEALNNIQKYAQATHVTIDLIQRNSHLELQIVDNGIGFDQNTITSGHYGLEIMRERASSINAQLTINSVIDQGTVIKLTWHIKNGKDTHDE